MGFWVVEEEEDEDGAVEPVRDPKADAPNINESIVAFQNRALL
jgi:hypothetical protein